MLSSLITFLCQLPESGTERGCRGCKFTKTEWMDESNLSKGVNASFFFFLNRRRKYFFIMQKVPPTPDRGRVYISTGYIHPALCSIQCCCELELQSTCGCVFMYDKRDSLDPVSKIKHACTRLGSL
ncbi:hypothetical protein ILYODFUR_030983 [Ilyodon furcidens]|uniref:Uncharacterized protein n=1 Tax=Ilyodon furcidens TaxID=33524 RepID=A0ABV0VLJ4_9TELE